MKDSRRRRVAALAGVLFGGALAMTLLGPAPRSGAAAAAVTDAVFGWGDDSAGQLADGTHNTTNTPVVAKGLSGQLVQVVSAGRTGLAICRDCDPNVQNTVWSWGADPFDNFGVPASGVGTCHLPDISALPCSLVPVEVRGAGGLGHLSGVVQIASDGGHVLAVDSRGSVWAWGYDYQGDAGPAPVTACPSSNPAPCVPYPALMPVVHDVTDVSAGGGFSLAVQRDGTVWGWGDNSSGELGQGTDEYNSGQYASATPLQVKNPRDPSGFLQRIVAAAGYDHTTAIQRGSAADGSQNTMWSWGGDNSGGQLGTGYLGSGASGSRTLIVNLPQPVVTQPGGRQPFTGALALGEGAATVVKFDPSGADTLWGWGLEFADGGAGDFGTTARTTPRQFHASSGTDCNTPGPFLVGVPPDSRAITRSAAIVKQPGQDEGTVWLWGFNFYGPYAPPTYYYNCRFPVHAQGITASAISSGGADFDLAIGQVLAPPPTPTPAPGPTPTPPPVTQSGPGPAAGPGTTPPQPGVPVTASQPGVYPAVVQGQPPGPGAGVTVGASAAQGNAASVPGTAAAPAPAPGPGAATGSEPAANSADEYAMVRHDDGIAAPIGLTAAAIATLVSSILALGRRRSGVSLGPSPAHASTRPAHPTPPLEYTGPFDDPRDESSVALEWRMRGEAMWDW